MLNINIIFPRCLGAEIGRISYFEGGHFKIQDGDHLYANVHAFVKCLATSITIFQSIRQMSISLRL